MKTLAYLFVCLSALSNVACASIAHEYAKAWGFSSRDESIPTAHYYGQSETDQWAEKKLAEIPPETKKKWDKVKLDPTVTIKTRHRHGRHHPLITTLDEETTVEFDPQDQLVQRENNL